MSKSIQELLADLQKAVDEAINGEHDIEMIFTEDVMKSKTKYNDIGKFFEAAPYEINSQEDYKNLPNGALDEFTKENTDFKNWEEFSKYAGTEFAKKELGKQGIKFS